MALPNRRCGGPDAVEHFGTECNGDEVFGVAVGKRFGAQVKVKEGMRRWVEWGAM